MSFLGGLFGNNGTNFQAQSGQQAGAPVNPLAGGAGSAVAGSQNAINQQQALANAIAQAGGVQNQQNVYNQLGQIAAGQGPNPAQAMLSQATAGNVAQTTAEQAGQRGASNNVGLLARQAGQQGAATQQNAAGQAATMQANQALGALGQQGNIAGQQVGNALTAQQGATSAAQTQAGQLIGANVAQGTQAIQNAQQQNASNAAIAGINAQGQQNLLGNVTNGVGSTLGALLAQGGVVHHFDAGGLAQTPQITNFGGANSFDANASGPRSSFGNALSNSSGNQKYQSGQTGTQFGQQLGQGLKSWFGKTPSSATPSMSSGQDMLSAMNGAAGYGQNGTATPGMSSGADMMSAMGQGVGAPGGGGVGAAPPMEASGGRIHYDDGGIADFGAGSSSPTSITIPSIGKSGGGGSGGGGAGGLAALAPLALAALAKGGKVPAMVSPGEKVINKKELPKVAAGKERAIDAGKTVAGKAKVAGNSYSNDTVKANLNEGDIVLPRSITQSKNPGPAAQKFVEALLSKQKGKKKVAA